MKEIGKLLELLNEYDSGWDYDDYYGPYQYGQDTDAYKYGKYYLVSRDYGFIQWLVDNDKIDRTKQEYYPALFQGEVGSEVQLDRADELIMLLSISENPIEFLVSMLK